MCAVCDVAGHEPDNVDVAIVARASPQWSCEKHDMTGMQVRLRGAIKSIPPKIREQNEAASEHKWAQTEIHPIDGQRLRAHVAQSDVIDLTGMGGAAATTAVSTAVGVAAAAQDAGASRPAPRISSAYASDVGAWLASVTRQPIYAHLDKRGNRLGWAPRKRTQRRLLHVTSTASLVAHPISCCRRRFRFQRHPTL